MPTALIVDVETTGLSPTNDEIIELAALAFEYDETAKTVGQILDTYTGLREPGCPISPQAQKVNHITDDMVRGQKLDDQHIQSLFSVADIIIAHNAQFDKSFIARLYPQSASKLWRCSMTDIDWAYKGHAFQSLQKLAKDYTIKISRSAAHRALTDCNTVYQLIGLKNNFQELLAGMDARIVELSPSGEDLYPVQVEGEQRYIKNLEEIAGYYDESEGCETWEQAFLYIDDNPRDLEHYVVIKINDLVVGYLKPGNAKTYRKRLATLGAPANAIGNCSASIRGGKMKGNFKTSLGVRLDFDLKEFEIKPYSPAPPSPATTFIQTPIVDVSSLPLPTPAPILSATQVQTHKAVKFGGKVPLIPLKGSGWAYWLIIFPFVVIIDAYIILFAGIWYVIKWLWDLASSAIKQ